MAYISPNSVIQLFQGINLDNRYLHTIYFGSESAQNSWFTGKVYKSYQNHSYQRYGTNMVKVKDDATSLLGCTYMRFMNSRTASKWFYAFITGIEYVNENTAIVEYEIDVMQTWFIQNGSVRPCMVLREHVNNDTFGLNLEAEPVGADCYDNDEIYHFADEFSSYSVVAQTTGATDPDEHLIQGLFNGCKYYHYTADTAGDGNIIFSEIRQLIGSWSEQQQQEAVIDLYTVPTFCCEQNGHEVDYGVIPTGSNIKIPSSYDNYTPKNKKLFMYPYSCLLVTTHTGDTAIYRWEYFEGTTGADCEFEVNGTMLGGGEVRCYPKSYNGQEANVDAGVVMNNFPKNTANYDAYQAWIAGGGSVRLDNDRVVNSFKGAGGIAPSITGLIKSVTGSSGTSSSGSTVSTTYKPNKNGNQYDIAKQVVTNRENSSNYGASSGLIGGIVSGIGNLIEARNNMEYTFKDAVYNPNIVVGKATSCLPVAMRDANFYFFHNHVRDDEAKRIDDFFSCYGYAVNKVKTPNLTGRQYWNFVKTENCVIAGNMPSSSKDAIARIFDSGITFWHNGDNVGNYAISVSNDSINNPIV